MLIYLFAAAAVALAIVAAVRVLRASSLAGDAEPVAPSPTPAPSLHETEEVEDEGEPTLESVLAKLAAVRRTTWVPETVSGDGAAADSKFSGAPYLPDGEAWPACGNCGRPMQLFVQLNARDLPPEGRARLGEGMLLQFFYCTSTEPLCEADCDAYAPGARSTLLRLIPAPQGAAGAPAVPEGMFPARRITGWSEDDDYPGFEERDELEIDLAPAEDDLLDDVTVQGEKLLGWPFWVQGAEYPDCRVCGQRMEFLFQIDSERNLPHMFGDAGVGHITQCPNHRGELAFGWACY